MDKYETLLIDLHAMGRKFRLWGQSGITLLCIWLLAEIGLRLMPGLLVIVVIALVWRATRIKWRFRFPEPLPAPEPLTQDMQVAS